MSIFASRRQQTIALPFDAPHTVTIQQLAGRALEQARQASQQASVESLQRLGGPAFQKALGALGDPVETAKRVAEAQADPMTGFDRYVLLMKGIKAWTYEEPVSEQTIDDLDEEAAAFLARAILQLTKPALFQTSDEQETARKNASGSSSVP